MVTDVLEVEARQISLRDNIADEHWFETERSNKPLQRIDFMKAVPVARRFENCVSLLRPLPLSTAAAKLTGGA